MSTIKEVAEQAQVSTATVSRVLNGNYPVSKQTYAKVMDAIKAVNYRPNALAKSLKTNKTFMIGFVVPDISNPYFTEIAKGVETIISNYGYTLTFCSSDEDPKKEIKLLKALNEKRVDFVILASSLKNEKPLLEIMKQGLKIIMVDTILPNLNVDFVVEDNEKASYKLVDYALQLGHKKIGIVNGIMDISTARERYEGYKKALKDHKIKYNPSYTVDGGYYRDIAYHGVKKMLQQNIHNLPTLIFATNNQMTEGAMIAIREMGLKIPDDISIVSFGDITLPQLVEPRLTVILHNSRAIGERAGEILMQRMENPNYSENYKTNVIPSEFVVRDSVKRL
ncbi:MAG: LacI family transcriptional regulator [Vallitalea sp.]|jgi:LacI family transcriptional regulator|nr:LacI family transcriptional regulator [Vallitalea sp.]